MPQIINTNIASLSAQRNLDRSQSANETALNRLSSGLRINSAKDDAAGLAISTRFDAQTKGLGVAIRNAGDGVSLAQTAEGALGSMTENLQRIRELSVQSANATNSDDDRAALQAEVEQLVAEITRTSEETTFNGRKLLDGSFEGTFQIGADAGQTLDIKIEELTADRLGVGSATGVSAMGTDSAIQNGDLSINGVMIDPSRANSDTASSVDNGASAIAKAAAINDKTDETGVKAVVNTNVAAGAEMVAGPSTGTISLNDVEIEVSTGGVNLQADREAVMSAINAKSDQTGVVAVSGGDTGGVILEAADGRNIDVSFGADFGLSTEEIEQATGLKEGTSYGGYTLISNDGKEITIEGGAGTGTGDISRAGLSAGVYSGREAAVTSTANAAGISQVETQGTFTTASFNLSSAQQINATNNSFEINVDGTGYQTITLDGTYDVDGTGALTAGQYDSAETLAAHITYAITDEDSATYDDNAAFRNADGSAKIEVTATADGGLQFTSLSEGVDSSVIVRQGDGTMAVPSDVTTTQGVDADAAVEVMSFNFIFDGKNTLATGAGANTLAVTATGGTGASGDLVLAQTSYTSAEEFAKDLNSALDGSNIAGEVAARVSDDGTKVELYSTDSSVTAIALSAPSGNSVVHNWEAEQIQHTSNGDAVLVDWNDFIDTAAATTTLNLTIDGTTTGELVFAADPGLGTTLAAAQGSADIADTVNYLNDLFSTQAAGTSLNAEAVGDQIVISSSAGALKFTTGTTNDIETGAAMHTASVLSAETTESVAGLGATLTTGSFGMTSDGTDGFEAGTFISSDPDGDGTGFTTTAAPLVIETGKNDTFNMTVDGGTEQTVTIAAGSYANMDELSAAINAGFESTSVSIATVSDTKADYNFSAGTDDLVMDISLNGSTATTITLDGNHSGEATLGEAQAAMLADLQTELDNAFGQGAITASISSDNKLLLNVADGDELVVSNIADTGVGTGGVFTATTGDNIPDVSTQVTSDGQALIFTSATATAASSIEVENGGFAITGGATRGEELTSAVEVNALESGDLVINGTAIGAASSLYDTASDTTALTSDASASGIATAAAINAATEQTGVTAEVNATSLVGGTSTTAASGTQINAVGNVYVNGVDTGAIQLSGDADRDRATAIDLINAKSGQTGVTAEDNGESITLTAADGRNISVAIDNKLAENAAAGRDSSDFGSKIGLDSSLTGIGEADFGGTSADYANTAGTTYSTVTLKSAGAISIENGVNGTDEIKALGLELGTYGGGEDGTFLKDLDISTFKGAQAAITAVDNALNQVASQRADLGALQNRFESTVSNLTITRENLTAANSRIKDADFAAESAELSRTQVLQQAGISILAQANQRPQQVLSLIG